MIIMHRYLNYKTDQYLKSQLINYKRGREFCNFIVKGKKENSILVDNCHFLMWDIWGIARLSIGIHRFPLINLYSITNLAFFLLDHSEGRPSDDCRLLTLQYLEKLLKQNLATLFCIDSSFCILIAV